MGTAPRLPGGALRSKTVFATTSGEMLYLNYFERGENKGSDSIYYFRGETVDFHGVKAYVSGTDFVVETTKDLTGFVGSMIPTYHAFEAGDEVLRRRYTDGAYFSILYP